MTQILLQDRVNLLFTLVVFKVHTIVNKITIRQGAMQYQSIFVVDLSYC